MNPLKLFDQVVSSTCRDVRNDLLADLREVIHFSEDLLDVSDEFVSRRDLGSSWLPWLLPWESARIVEGDGFGFERMVAVG